MEVMGRGMAPAISWWARAKARPRSDDGGNAEIASSLRQMSRWSSQWAIGIYGVILSIEKKLRINRIWRLLFQIFKKK